MTPITWYLYGRSGGAKKAVEEIGVKESASGDIAVISDGANDVAVKSLVAEITPVQDLHGQANPYPAGGGKNLIPFPYSKQSGTYNGVTITVNDDGTLLLNGTATSTVYWDLKSGADAVSMPAGSYILHRPSTTAVTGLTITAAKNGDFWNTASQANVNLTLENDAYVSWYIRVESGTTLSNVKVYPMFEKGTTASDWSPYSNIRPISGRTGLTVTRAGKNLLNPSLTYGLLSLTIGALETDITQSTRYGYTERFPSTADTVLSMRSTDTTKCEYARIAQYVDGVLVALSQQINFANTSTWYTRTLTGIPNSYCRLVIGAATSDCGDHIYGEGQVEFGSTATPYTPYVAPTTYPITWQTEAGTVYGGTLDVVSGVLTVDRGYFTDDGSANWIRNADGSFYYASGITNPYQTTVERCACNYAPYVFSYNGLSVFLRQSGFISLGKDWGNIYASAADLKAAFAQTPFQMVYPLATPQTYQLTPTEVRTLLGGNTIYTDAGSVSVDYIADTKLYIDNKVAELQALILEN